jgi:hypothetical protein
LLGFFLFSEPAKRKLTLRLAGMAKAFDDQQRQPDVTALTFEQRLGLAEAAGAGWADRGERMGGLPASVARPSDADLAPAPLRLEPPAVAVAVT